MIASEAYFPTFARFPDEAMGSSAQGINGRSEQDMARRTLEIQKKLHRLQKVEHDQKLRSLSCFLRPLEIEIVFQGLWRSSIKINHGDYTCHCINRLSCNQRRATCAFSKILNKSMF